MLKLKLNKNNRVLSSLLKIGGLFTVLLTSALTLNTANAAGDISNGEKLAQTCMGCHGVPGLRNTSPVYEIPKLGGQNAAYIVAALKGYKLKTRSHKTMQAQAASLSDQDMGDIAAYFAASKSETRARKTDKKLIALGKEKSATCVACHGKGGGITIDNSFPILAGQYESYIFNRLKEYRSTKGENAIMAAQVQQFDINELKALAAWFASQTEAENTLSSPETNIFKFN